MTKTDYAGTSGATVTLTVGDIEIRNCGQSGSEVVLAYPNANVREDLTSGTIAYASTGDDIWLESRLRTSSLKTEKAQIR